MKPSTYAAAAIASFAWFIPVQADAARCPAGYVYRASAHVCQTKAKAQRAGVRIYSRASTRHRYKRQKAPPVQRAQQAEPILVATMPRSPMIDGAAPEQIAASPFGGLIFMPESPVSWALRNVER